MDKEMEIKLRQVQKCCLDIAVAIDNICVKHRINYSLIAGSVIGQYLYQGFIPWDDDIDIMMTRDNYNRFLEVAEEELPTPLKLVKCNPKDKTNVLFSKVINEDTTIVERTIDGSLRVSGIFVDITVFDKLPSNKIIRLYDIAIMKLMHISIVGKVDGRNALRNALAVSMRNRKTTLYSYLQRLLEKNKRYDKYDYAELFYGLTIAYKKNIFENYSRVPFEDKTLSMVTDFMDYLETRYGRREFYRNDENAKPPHLLYVSLEIPYKDFDIGLLN